MLEGVQRMESRRVQPLRLGGCSHLRDFVDDKTDEISYRFPIVNARKLSRSLSFFLFLLSSSLPHLLFFSSLYGIFFRDRECTRVNEQLSDRKERKKEISRPSFLCDFEAIFLFSLHDSSFPSLLSSPLHFLRSQCVGYLSSSYPSGWKRTDSRWRQTYNTTK